MAQLLYATKILKEGEEPTANVTKGQENAVAPNQKKVSTTDKSIKAAPKDGGRESTGPATVDKTKKPIRPQTARVVPPS